MDVSASPRAGSLSLLRQRVGAVPVLNRVLARLGLTEIVARYLPADDARLKIAPAVVVGVVVRNLLVGHRPAYAIGDWAAGFDPALFGLGPGQVRQLTDDRIARVLDRLFDADRASLLTDLIVRMVTEFDVDTGRCHNDSTSITFSGARPDRGGGQRGGTPVPLLHHGHNKDHRPDLPQLVWILTVAADGAVPLAHRVANGNTTDDCTHIDTWNGLVKLLGRADFLYVADAKLATREQMDHIHRHGGRFITTLPRSRTEDRYFRREWLTANTPTWVEARRRPGPRLGDPDDVWSTFAFPQPSAEGHRIIWVLSSRRAHTDAADRTRRIQRACTALDELNERLSRPRSRTRTLLAADQAADAVLADAGGTAWITHYPEKINEFTYRQAGSGGGHPTPDTRYRRIERPYWTIRYQIDADAVARDALSDGCYPLITTPETSPTRRSSTTTSTSPISNGATTCSSPTNSSRRCSCNARTASKRCCAATSSPYSSAPSSNANSAKPWQTGSCPTSTSTPRHGPAPHPAPTARSNCSHTSPATPSTTKTDAHSRPSRPTSVPNNDKSSACSAYPPTPTQHENFSQPRRSARNKSRTAQCVVRTAIFSGCSPGAVALVGAPVRNRQWCSPGSAGSATLAAPETVVAAWPRAGCIRVGWRGRA
jgi:uncharacterized protein DUF4277